MHSQSSNEDEDESEKGTNISTAVVPFTPRKRHSSEPPERTNNDLQGDVPIFSSFQLPNIQKPNTTVRQRSGAELMWSFPIGVIVGPRARARITRPSLNHDDTQVIPPIFPPAQSSVDYPQLPSVEVSSFNAAPSNRKDKATHATDKGPGMATENKLKAVGSQLATIPEDAAVNVQATPAGVKKREGYGFDYDDEFAGSSDSDDDSTDEEEDSLVQPEPKQPPGKGIITPNTSFEDVVVMRDVRQSFEYTMPFATTCTHARLE